MTNSAFLMRLGATLALFAATANPAAAAPADRWAAYQGNVEHNGYLPRHLLLQPTTPAWTNLAIAGQSVNGLAVSDGLVFTTHNRSLVAQRLADGHIVWSHDFGFVGSVSPPAIDSGNLYLQTSDLYYTYVHKFQIDGTFLWRAPFQSQDEAFLGPIVVDGTLYFDGGMYGGAYSFDTQDGYMNWYTNLPQFDRWSPTWWNGSLVIYTNRLDVLTASSGADSKTIADPGFVFPYQGTNQAPVVVGDYAYATNAGRLLAFDMQAGTQPWALAIGASGQVATDGTQLFVVAGSALSVRDPATGAEAWSWTPPASHAATPGFVVTDSHVVVGDGTSTYLVNRTTHTADATYAASGLIAYAADVLVIADTGGGVHAFSLPSDAIFRSAFE